MTDDYLFQQTLALRPPGLPIFSPRWRASLEDCHFFGISDGVIRYATRLTLDCSGDKIMPFCRMPHPRMFIEYSEVALHRETGTEFPTEAGKWERAAIFLERDVSGFIACTPVLPFGLPMLFCFARRTTDGAETEVPSPYYMPEAIKREMSSEPMVMADMKAMTLRYRTIYPAILALINCPNLTEVSAHPGAALQRSRHADSPSNVRHRVKIKLSRVQQRRSGAEGERAHMRLHTVRGHFKIRKTGIYWWSDFWRGDADVGRIEKSYGVQP